MDIPAASTGRTFYRTYSADALYFMLFHHFTALYEVDETLSCSPLTRNQQCASLPPTHDCGPELKYEANLTCTQQSEADLPERGDGTCN